MLIHTYDYGRKEKGEPQLVMDRAIEIRVLGFPRSIYGKIG